MNNYLSKLLAVTIITGLTAVNLSAKTWSEPERATAVETDKSQPLPKVKIRAGHARALQMLADEKYQEFDYKTLMLTIDKLTDSQGLSYLAARVADVELAQYLKQMRLILSDDYQEYRRLQDARDHGEFHLTLVNPMEYQALTDKTSLLGQRIRVQLHGLGRVSQGKHSAYFVVASSSDGQFLRQNLLLSNKDFHITLGFQAKDIHGVSKGQETLIK